MKKLIMFFAGIILIGLMVGALFLTGLVYDTGDRQSVKPYFFRPNNMSVSRPDYPLTVQQIGDNGMIELFLDTFVKRYFYVIPSEYDLTNRTNGGAALLLAGAAVFNQWRNTELPQIKEIVSAGGMRTARIINDVIYPTPDNQYYIVEYELTTWPVSNDMDVLPTITHGRMFVDVGYGNLTEFRDDIDFNPTRYLERGGDVARLFRFRVNQAIMETD